MGENAAPRGKRYRRHVVKTRRKRFISARNRLAGIETGNAASVMRAADAGVNAYLAMARLHQAASLPGSRRRAIQ